MQQYKKLLKLVLDTGELRKDRTGTGTRSLFALDLEHDLQEGFPVLTGKRVNWKAAIAEMLWFMSGSTLVKDLRQLGTSIWDNWELPDGTIGPGYGAQMRDIKFTQILEPKPSKAATVSKSPSKIFSVGTFGDISQVPVNIRALLLESWMRILNEVSSSRYMQESWFEFANFAKDVQKAPNWTCKLEWPDRWQLSNAFRYATRQWAQDTVSWVPNDSVTANKENFSRVSGRSEERQRSIDPLAKCVAGLRHDPHSRRHVVSLWNEHDLERMALPPCHGCHIQFYVRNNEFLDLMQVQRSADLFLGVPFNLVGYGFLAHAIAAELKLKPGRLKFVLGDAHIYENHRAQVEYYLSQPTHTLPTLCLDKKPWHAYTPEDVRLLGYTHGPTINAPVSI